MKTKLLLLTTCAAGLLIGGCATDGQAKNEQRNATAPEQQLKVGMTKPEVEKTLGKPSSTSASSDGTEVWMYNDMAKAWIPFYAIGGGKFKSVTITFDEGGKVKNWTTGKTSIY